MTLGTPQPNPKAEKERQRRAAEHLAVKPSGKWDNPRPFGMGRHTKRYLNRATGEVVLDHATGDRVGAIGKRRAARKARNKAQKRARRNGRG